MLKIAICDDERVIAYEIERIIRKYGERTNRDLETEVFTDGKNLINQMEQGSKFDLVFLDIEMGEIDGLEIGEQIRNKIKDYNTKIIIVSANSQYALRAYDIMPLGFITKPFEEHDIITAIEKVITLNSNKQDYLTYTINKDIYRIKLEDIYYLESDKREIIIVNRNKTIRYYDKLNNVETKLQKYGFYRISKSIIVNEIYVRAIEGNEIILSNQVKLKIGVTYIRNISALLRHGGILW